MSVESKLQQCTTPFRDYLLKDLSQAEFARDFLDAALQDFAKDGNIEMLLLSMKDIADAQGGIDSLVSWTRLSPKSLSYLLYLYSEQHLQLDKVLDIISKLKNASTQ